MLPPGPVNPPLPSAPRENRQTLLLLLSNNKELWLYLLLYVFIQGCCSGETPPPPAWGAGFQPATSVFCQRVCFQTDGGGVRAQGWGSLPAAREMCLRFLLFSQLTSCRLTAWKTGWRSLSEVLGRRTCTCTHEAGELWRLQGVPTGIRAAPGTCSRTS